MSRDPLKTRLSRRQALGALGTVSLGGLLAACGDDGATGSAGTTVTTTDGATATVQPKTTAATTGALFDDSASCAVSPEQTEGPYYFDADKIRSDIREDREGTRLRLALRVRDAASCEPISDAVVDIWHADAGGAYSGFDGSAGGGSGASGGGPGGGGGAQTDSRYLRGAQVTNAAGIVEFTTIYPGWYPGRTVHIHAKVHLDARTVLTTQLYFEDALSNRVFAAGPYSERGERDQRNESDGIFDADLVVTARREGDSVRAAMTFDVRQA